MCAFVCSPRRWKNKKRKVKGSIRFVAPEKKTPTPGSQLHYRKKKSSEKMTRSRVVQAAISAFYRRRASAATSTSYCSRSFISRSSGNAGIKHLRCTSSVSMAMPSSPTTPSLPLDHFPSRGFRFHSFTSMSTASLYHFASRNEVAKSNIEKSIKTSDRGFSSSTSSTSSSTGGAEEGGENANHHLDEAAFHAAADETLHDLVDALETWVDCEVEGDEADVEYSVRLVFF